MKYLRFFLSLSLIFLFISTAHSTTVKRLSLKEMVKEADIIFYGKVTDVHPHFISEKGRAIATDVSFKIFHLIKGKPDKINTQNFTITLVGGKVGNIVMKIPGMPEFYQGEEVLLFLKKVNGKYTILGLPQGKFTVVRDKNGEKIAVRKIDKGILFDPETNSYHDESVFSIKLKKLLHIINLFMR